MVVGDVSGEVEGVYLVGRARRARKLTPCFSAITNTTTTTTVSALCFRGCSGYITACRRLLCRVVLKQYRHLPYWVSCGRS